MKLLFAFLIALGTFFFAHQSQAATYYIDLENGSDAAAGTATTTAWRSLDQFADNTRSAGDIAWVRRGTASTTVYSDIIFTSDGTLNNPIIMSADYDNLWGDFTNSTQTYNVTFGTTTFSSSASTTDIQPGDWVYVVGDHTEDAGSPTIYGKDFAYEVATTTTTYIQFYLPYKGPSTGSGKTLRVMPNAPVWNNTAGDFNFTMSVDDFWYFKGLDVRGTDAAYTLNPNGNSKGMLLFDMIVQTDGTTAGWVGNSDVTIVIQKSRFFGTNAGGIVGGATVMDAYMDCVGGVGAPFAFTTNRATFNVSGVEAVNCASDVIGAAASPSGAIYGRDFKRKNAFANLSGSGTYILNFEDDNSIPGLNVTSSNKISSDTLKTTTTMSTTLDLRSGGADKNLLVFPPSGTGNTGISTAMFPNSFIKLFDYPVRAASNTPYTFTVYFRQASSSPTSDWTADPTASELWIEAEYFGDPVDANRKLTKSTGTLDFNGTDDWQSLSVSATTTRDGLLNLRGWYGKPLESGKENSFKVDIKLLVTSP